MALAQGNTVSQVLQGLDLDAQIILYELDMGVIGGPIVRYHNGTNEMQQSVVFGGQPFNFMPIQCSGFEWSGKGPFPQPKLTVANLDGYFTVLNLNSDDLIGVKVTRRRTLVRFLDAVNFASGTNPTADPTQEFNRDVFYIERKSQDLGAIVTYELKTSLDMQGRQIPLRAILADVCTWKYRGPDCGYVPGPMFTITDQPTTDPSKDVCGLRLKSCKLRYGENNVLPFGGAPAAGLITT